MVTDGIGFFFTGLGEVINQILIHDGSSRVVTIEPGFVRNDQTLITRAAELNHTYV
ncbi:hypothetical protein [Rhizobium sp. GCM10022189]|uniref:hypothetical protein n=1 Tax=Rhizobium sp. GCM10022189 TaxID=3252654 RepID=UPI00361397C0